MESVLQIVLADGPIWLYVVSALPGWVYAWIVVVRAWDRRQDDRWEKRQMRQCSGRKLEEGPPRPPHARRAS